MTKSPLAKRFGVKTGVSIVDALSVMPNLIVLPANYPLYLFFTNRMREIALQYTDKLRAFGLDEFWISLYGNRDEAMKTVYEIRKQFWRQLCLTVSIGVGENLPYAKIGSDLAPNDGVFELWDDERVEKVYPLPVSDLLYVGPSTTEKFNKRGILTIGDLANSDPKRICRILQNKTGETLWTMANGQDKTPVETDESYSDIKTIGNSNTMFSNLLDNDEVKAAFFMLAESVATRMKEGGFEAKTIKISVRDNGLVSFERQMKLKRPTNLVAELVPAAMELFKRTYNWAKPVRSLGIRGADLVSADGSYQLNLFDDETKRNKLERLERCTDRLRGRYGHFALQRGILMQDRRLKGPNAFYEEKFPIFYQY